MQSNTTPPVTFSLRHATVTLKHKAEPHGLYIEDILATFGSRSQTALILLFTVPFLQPIPLLGLSIPIGMLLFVFAYFIVMNRPLWLPRKIMRKHVSAEVLVSTCNFLMKVLSKTEKWVKPRMSGWASHRATQVLNGILIMIFAFLMALPLPIPFSNSVPAWFIVLNALGEVEEDGVLMWISYAVAIAGACFFFGLGVGVQEIVTWFSQRF